MKVRLIVAWMLLPIITKSSLHGVDSEEPMASSWLEGDWSAENSVPEQVAREILSGCICRYKYNVHVVCYGGPKCATFPANLTIPQGIFDLRIKTTTIEVIHRNDLQKLSVLTTLQLDANYRMHKIAPGAFSSMSKLKNLSISYNSELRQLHPDTFFGLINLEKLRMIKNGFDKIIDATQALKANYIPKLQSISLNENSFSGDGIGEEAFAPLKGSNVKELELILCQIERIHPKSLNVFQKLKILRLGDNLISEEQLSMLFEEFIDKKIPVELLNLYNLGFRNDGRLTDLLDVISRLNVSHLILSRNHIENLSLGLFPYMPNIRILDLREMSVLTMETGALRQEVLPKLTALLLAGNKLPGILPGVLLPQLSLLDLSQNTGGAYSLSYFDVPSYSLSGMKDLESLDLSYNRVSTISNLTFVNLRRLRVLGLQNSTIFYIAPGAFSKLDELQVLNLAQNPFQPFNNFEFPIFEGLDKLQTLLLEHCKIRSFKNINIFKPLKKLKYLNLKDNEITYINPLVLLTLPSLVGIDFTDNRIQPWKNGSCFQNNQMLKILIMPGNRLSSLSGDMMGDFVNITRLDISQNAFVCDCFSFKSAMAWLNQHDTEAYEVTALLSPSHICASPEKWRDKTLVSFLNESSKNCLGTTEKLKLTTGAYAIIGALIIVSLLLGTFSYFYRWHIRYWMFLIRMTFLRRHGWLLKNNKVHPADYKYDVFVSYSHEDRNFIVRLVSMLENQHPFLKLCVYERDFEIGTVISDTVMDKVTSSRRTLLVVSNAFAKSQWCMWEMQLAEYHRLFFRPWENKEKHSGDPLIIVKLGPVAACNMTPTLKFLLKSRIYLEWSNDAKKEQQFWDKLRKSLAHNKNSVANQALSV